MIIIASTNGAIGIPQAWEILEQGGTALDAVEAATRIVEDNPDDHTVGYGGYPNLVGDVELDASIMDGTTLQAGAVGALRGYRYAITVARRVMEELPHVMLAGEGAARFAAEMGMQSEHLLTEQAAQVWRAGIDGQQPTISASQTALLDELRRHTANLTSDPERVSGTVNFIAQDRTGHIASAVSTSGWAWKYPGRVGDSPVIGAGNYADDRYGAAACTGWGELAIRAGTTRCVVLYLKLGYTLEEACHAAFADLIAPHEDPGTAIMSMVALDRHGNHCAVSTSSGRTYVYQAAGMTNLEELPRLVITPGQK
ncbi:MAG: asparaginase [Chloroflexi bacterium AL-W]|nr:asparaginase [Chloroflexi bacterium AL-N1]NOK71677.1 asparaginase [Chloroflexi bacterium AL-N10]NOK79018.1 asparaginase [Chloroflexi bacterium AL-N5]NOK86452.1 asparaginase [Chloroflexi bacterium AL-W]NOK93418.1 asparaginase [Chloroflexi bacterium AL-N15]